VCEPNYYAISQFQTKHKKNDKISKYTKVIKNGKITKEKDFQ
jgi:hypothetical protein